MRKKIILSSSYVLPVSSPPIKDGAVYIENDKIIDIGCSKDIKAKYPKISIHNFQDSILMPGLVNAHIHLEYSALGPLKKQVDFVPWIKDLIVRQKALPQEEINSSIKKAVNGLISSGVTSVGEVSRSGLSLDELKESGLRGVYYNEFVAVDDKRLELAIRDFEANFRNVKRKLGKSNLKTAGFPHSPYTLSTKSLKYISSFCKKNKVPCAIHAAESPYENEFIFNGSGQLSDFVKSFGLDSLPVSGKWSDTFEYLKYLKMLNPLTQLVHCVHIEEKGLRFLKKSKSGIVLCPRSNYLLKNGKFPIQKALKYNLKMGFGTDSLASNYSLDMFEEVRKLMENSNISKYSEQLIKMMTLGGAEILGLGKEIGSLDKGKKADIIAIKMNTSQKRFSLLNYLLSESKAKDICFTMINGVVKYNLNI